MDMDSEKLSCRERHNEKQKNVITWIPKKTSHKLWMKDIETNEALMKAIQNN